MPAPVALFTRRSALVGAGVLALLPGRSAAQETRHPQHRWYASAQSMRELALSWGDQGYGAVLVIDDAVVGEGPSRVVRDRNPDAHAERVALHDAQRRLGRQDLSGAVLYSTSRPCPACERAAALARVTRMYHGPALEDAGQPQARQR